MVLAFSKVQYFRPLSCFCSVMVSYAAVIKWSTARRLNLKVTGSFPTTTDQLPHLALLKGWTLLLQ